ncbi:MAG TPA: formylglycine-generating enzyme family protein [Chitinophagaceae bacterium]|nr:formylglycine-generating enzyme family protein [Chitinophagaceae bacterium]
MRSAIIIFILLCMLPAVILAQDTAYTNSIGMKFVLVRPGSMIVGRFQPTVPPPGGGLGGGPGLADSVYKKAQQMAKEAYMPGFYVAIRQPFYLGQFEVTQEQWKKVMGNNPSYFQGDKVTDDAGKHPVENVTWNDAQQFIQKLNKLEQGKAVYRLPTEFEWEYAARAGAQDDISWKDIFASAVISERHTHEVGEKKPNAWGLYDMLGNVWEWVQDFYNEKIFADPVPPVQGSVHVLKGSSFTGDVKNATYMTHAAGPADGWNVGFRVVMEVK